MSALTITLCAVATAGITMGSASASSTTGSNSSNSDQPLGVWEGNKLRIDMTVAPVLSDPSYRTTIGTRADDGGCDIPPPMLELSPGQDVIAAQQVVVDLNECSTLWQIGTPLTDDWVDTSGMTHASSPSIGDLQTDMASGTITPLATQVSAGYYKAWIVDIINLTVTSVKQNVAWSWTGSCVTSRSADVDTYWRSGSGWEPPYNTSYLLGDNGCPAKWGTASATFRNTGFCWPNTVYNVYSSIRAEGRANGDLVSGGSATHSGNGGCAPLTEKYELKRTVN